MGRAFGPADIRRHFPRNSLSFKVLSRIIPGLVTSKLDGRLAILGGRLTQLGGWMVQLDGRLTQLDGCTTILDARLVKLDG